MVDETRALIRELSGWLTKAATYGTAPDETWEAVTSAKRALKAWVARQRAAEPASPPVRREYGPEGGDRRACFAQLSELGIDPDDREARLKWWSELLTFPSRQLSSSAEFRDSQWAFIRRRQDAEIRARQLILDAVRGDPVPDDAETDHEYFDSFVDFVESGG